MFLFQVTTTQLNTILHSIFMYHCDQRLCFRKLPSIRTRSWWLLDLGDYRQDLRFQDFHSIPPRMSQQHSSPLQISSELEQYFMQSFQGAEKLWPFPLVQILSTLYVLGINLWVYTGKICHITLRSSKSSKGDRYSSKPVMAVTSVTRWVSNRCWDSQGPPKAEQDGRQMGSPPGRREFHKQPR